MKHTTRRRVEHFTTRTVAASAWCARCRTATLHRVDGVHLGPCIPCMEALERHHQQHPQPTLPRQLGLFP